MSRDLQLFWPHEHSGISSAFGYTTFERKLKKALEAEGVLFSAEAELVVHFNPLYHFRMYRFKKNLIFTMIEFDRVPSQWHTLLDRAELVIVPCEQNRRIFQAATDTIVEICPGGVDVRSFPYVERKKKTPFTFLFLGADNQRKGTEYAAKAWKLWNERHPELSGTTQLIMKLTSYEREQEFLKVTENSYVDYRVLPLTMADAEKFNLPTMATLYQFADCFLLPTMGEGWCLPLCEAMSTGLPCIYTPWGGPEDTASAEYAYPIEHDFIEIQLRDPTGADMDRVKAAKPDIESIVSQMESVYFRYDEALKKGALASKMMRERFTWGHSASRLIEILKGYQSRTEGMANDRSA